MRTFRRSHAGRSTRVLVIVLLVLLVLGALSIVLPDSVVGPVLSVVKPVWELRLRISEWSDTRFASLAGSENLVKENKELREELVLLKLHLFDRDSLAQENKDILALFGRGNTQTLVLGNILTRPSVTPYDTFIIDVGSKEDLSVGDRVFAAESVVIGFVESVFSKSARIQLFSSPGVTTDAFVSSSGVPVVATGVGGGNFRALVPEEVDAPIGDAIVLPEAGGLVLGTISAVEQEQNDTNKTLLFRTSANTSTLRFVFIEVSR